VILGEKRRTIPVPGCKEILGASFVRRIDVDYLHYNLSVTSRLHVRDTACRIITLPINKFDFHFISGLYLGQKRPSVEAFLPRK
jgi:hypothetical protein